MMDTLLGWFLDVVLAPGVAYIVGTMWAVAILLGFFFYKRSRYLVRWILTFLVYLAFQEGIRYAVLTNIGQQITYRPLFLVIISSSTFSLFLAIGSLMAHRLRWELDREEAEALSIVEQIQRRDRRSREPTQPREPNSNPV